MAGKHAEREARRKFNELAAGTPESSVLAWGSVWPTKTEFICPFCKRSGARKTKHHLVPKCRGGKITVDCCRDCHKAIHTCFSNKELERSFHTTEALQGNERFRKMIRFISKQDPLGKVKFDRPRDQRGRGKYR